MGTAITVGNGDTWKRIVSSNPRASVAEAKSASNLDESEKNGAENTSVGGFGLSGSGTIVAKSDVLFFFAKHGITERNQSVTHGSKDKNRRLTTRRGRPSRVRGRQSRRGGRLAKPPAKQRRSWHTRRQASCSIGASIQEC